MKKTKIDWCDCTVNPVVGCKNGCKYCYADKLNDRFHFVKNFRCPEYKPERLKQLQCKTPKSVFMDSMSDFGWWKIDWCSDIYYNGILKNPQHKYIFLTKGYDKFPETSVGQMFFYRHTDSPYGEQRIFLGKTVTTQDRFDLSEQYDFLSIEPILEPLDLSGIKYSMYIKLVIIGAETGNRPEKVIPQKEWIDSIVKACDEGNVRVFMKESLRKIMGADFRQDKLLWEIEK